MSDLYAEPSAQQYPAHRGDGFGPLIGVIKDQSIRLREVTSGLLRSSGILMTKLGMTISSSLTVEGDLAATGSTDIDGTLSVDAATTIGGTLGVTGETTLGASTSVTGALTVSGPMAVTGTLSLPAGIIDNDALANPVMPAGASNTATAFGLSTTESIVVSASTVVPAGFSRCLATGLGSIFFLNPTTAVDYVYARVFIEAPGQSWWGIRPLSMVGPSNGSAALAPNWMVLLEGLNPGDVVTFSLRARTGFAAMSASSNLGGITGQCLFFR